ncbi:MAG: ABC transporter permease [Pelosinus sp.]|nr:ABC transporter permease [Pelosinus sp.]
MSDNLFTPIDASLDTSYDFSRPSTSYWQDVWRRLKKNKLALAGLFIIILVAIIAILGPFFTAYSYSDQDLKIANQSPSLAHWFGTDNLGRDLLTRVLYGARISLSIGIVASISTMVIGVLYGGIAGLAGGRIDDLMMRLIDIMWSIPWLLYVILLMVVMQPGLTNIFIALALVYWMPMARIVRGQILSLRELEYVMAARLAGAGSWRIIIKHLIPNSLGPILITATLTIPDAIFSEAFLSYIGLGVSAPMASWGVLASEGATSLRSYPFQLFFPAIAICITMLSFNFLGDGLRDALDPKMRK